jgi:hypothetical protein
MSRVLGAMGLGKPSSSSSSSSSSGTLDAASLGEGARNGGANSHASSSGRSLASLSQFSTSASSLPGGASTLHSTTSVAAGTCAVSSTPWPNTLDAYQVSMERPSSAKSCRVLAATCVQKDAIVCLKQCDLDMFDAEKITELMVCLKYCALLIVLPAS